jgi:8-oxo-dGTP pyrophosphatase MutT (NUDIX family)
MPWRITERKLLAQTKFFSVHQHRKQRLSGDDRSHDFYVLEFGDWANVVPVTEAGEVVFIELHRHGIDGPSLEIPGGMVDPGDLDPAAAAARELREETGYEAERLVPIGVVHPNPALQANRCHTFLAENARLSGESRPDEAEDIRVVLHPVRDVPRLLQEGRITHALVVAALYWFLARVSGSERR